MARQIIVLTLVFFAGVGTASARPAVAAPPLPPISAGDASGLAASPTGKDAIEDVRGGSISAGNGQGMAASPAGQGAIGSISGGSASDAAPVGGPVAEGAFPVLEPSPATPAAGAAAAVEATTVAGAIAAGVVCSALFL